MPTQGLESSSIKFPEDRIKYFIFYGAPRRYVEVDYSQNGGKEIRILETTISEKEGCIEVKPDKDSFKKTFENLPEDAKKGIPEVLCPLAKSLLVASLR